MRCYEYIVFLVDLQSGKLKLKKYHLDEFIAYSFAQPISLDILSSEIFFPIL